MVLELLSLASFTEMMESFFTESSLQMMEAFSRSHLKRWKLDIQDVISATIYRDDDA